MPEVNNSVRSRYLDSDKTFNLQKHLEQLEKEEKSGLKGIEIREKAKELGKDDFLKILITQLSQQDPTNPMKDQDFIAQMAQFSALEQMKNISTGISRMESKQAYSIVGKMVSGPDLVTGEDVVGIAGAIFLDGDGKTYVRVNGRTIDIEKIHFISEPSLWEDSSKASANPTPQTLEPTPSLIPNNPNNNNNYNNNDSIQPNTSFPAKEKNPISSPFKSYASQAYEENIPGYKPTPESSEDEE